ncbi:protein kinase domain-containing protein [Candidatus Uabimicrobium amorphum]|uniref:protein kinase domain-containing protein n=1 Tax=Uabimicrobium amorphum TaxID=2596890 RepID=UPI0034A12967
MDDNKKIKNTIQETLVEVPAGTKREQMPKRIGRYEIISELGRGGMGVVFKAQDSKLHRIVALKVLIGNILTQERKERFFAEARSMAKLNHENIIKLYDYGEDNGVCFFTMDYIEGQTLDEVLKQKAMSLKQTVALIEKICQAMHYCHSQKIIHRDLKPSNIMIKNGKPYVMDFGIAKEVSEDGLTKPGSIMGSPHYMSPEQAEGDRKKIDHRSDIYSLGMILYRCLTGKTGFAGDSIMKTLMKIMKEDPVAPRQINPRIPENLEKICLKALEKKRENRYQSMHLFARYLRRFLDGGKVNLRLAKKEKAANKTWLWVSISAIVFVLVALMSMMTTSPLDELREEAETYIAEGFSQKAVTTAQQILHKEITDDEAWEIWFLGNYQLLSKSFFADVKNNIKKMEKNFPFSLETERDALQHALDTHDFIAQKSFKKAQNALHKLRDKNALLMDDHLTKTVANLQKNLKDMQAALEKEMAEQKRKDLEREKQQAKEKERQRLASKQQQNDNNTSSEEKPFRKILKDQPFRKILEEEPSTNTTTQMFRYNPARNGHTTAPDVTRPTVKYQMFIDEFPFITAPVIHDNMLYIHSIIAVYKIDLRNNKIISAFSKLHKKVHEQPRTFKKRHRTVPEERSALLLHKGILYFACNHPNPNKNYSDFCAVQTRGRGKLIASAPIPSRITTSPTVYKDTIYIGCQDGNVYALKLQGNTFHIQKKYLGKKLRAVVSAPVLYRDQLIFQCDGMSIFRYKLNLPSHQPTSIRVDHWGATTPVAYDDMTFAATATGAVVCIDKSFQNVEWHHQGPEVPIHSSLGVSGNYVYMFFSDGVFQIYDRAQKKPAAFGYIGPTRCSPVITKRYMYIGNNASQDEGSILHVFDLNNLIHKKNKIRIHHESKPLQGDIVAEPLLYNGRIYVVTTAGNLYVMGNE